MAIVTRAARVRRVVVSLRASDGRRALTLVMVRLHDGKVGRSERRVNGTARPSDTYATQLVWLIACPPEKASMVVTFPLVRMMT